jgi:hypothetical protein
MNKEYLILDNDDIYSICVKATNGLDNIVSFLNENNLVKTFSQDLSPLVSSTIIFSENLIQKKQYSLNFDVDKTDNQISTITGRFDQSTFDLCNMAYGDLNNYVKFLSDNNCNNKTDAYGLVAIFDRRLVSDNLYAQTLRKSGVVYNTLYLEQTFTPPIVEGGAYLFEDGAVYLFEDGSEFIFD